MKKTKVLYSAEQLKRDENKIAEAEQGKSPLDYSAFKRLMIHDLCANTDIISSNRIGLYSLEQIQNAISNPSSNSAILIATSRYLMSVSSFYMRIVMYFAKMGIFNYSIDTYGLKENQIKIDDYLNSYSNLCAQLEKMNLRHEFSKIMDVLPVDDVYCGLVMEDKKDFFFLHVPLHLCKIVQIQDGVYSFKVNLSGIDPLDIGGFPNWLQQAFLDYRNKKQYSDGWYTPPADKQICIKLNESNYYPFPLMIMMAKDIFDLDTYKNLKLQKARVDNYKAIIIEIPIDKNTVDKPLLTEEILGVFAEMNKENMPDDVGLIHALGEAEAVSFKDNTNNTNNLSDAIENIYDSSGVPSVVFNGGKTSTALKFSVENDSALIYRLYRQFERWINRFIKIRNFNKAAYKFAVRIQDSTVFNKDTVSDYYLKAAEHGLPFKVDYAISLGLTPSRMMGNTYCENIALKLHENLIPLPTSYTQSSEDVGRPTNEADGKLLSESGEITKDTDGNVDR